MLKKLICSLILFSFLVSTVSAYTIVVRPLDSSGNEQPETGFDYRFEFSNDSACSYVIFSHDETIRTSESGIAVIKIDTSSVTQIPKYICEYKNLIKRTTHNVSDQFFDKMYVDSINATNNITASFFFGDGSQLTGLAGGGDINGVTTTGAYLSGGVDSGIANLLFNETKLNSTIDSRGGGDTWWGLNENYIYNNSNSLDFNETKLNATIELLDTDTTYTNGTGINLTGTIFSIAISYFTDRFIELTDSFGGDVSGTYDAIVVKDDSHTHAYQNITNEPWIEDSQESNLNVNSSDNWDNLDTPMDITEMNNFTANKINATCCVYLGTIQSTDGNSIRVQPTGDEDDFFSFKTPAHRPTIKREGGKFIYIESSNVYDVGISFRADDTYSGTLNYEKDNHKMTLIGKNSPIGFKPNSEYNNYILLETFNHQPQMSVYNGTKLLINDSLEVNGIVNATGKVYSEGVEVLTSSSDTNASTACSDGEFLNGDGTCDAGYLDADGVDSDTNTNCSIDDSCSGIAYDSEINKTYVDTQDSSQDACSEITGCIENAITDGNTNWDNSYGLYNNITNFTGTLTNDKICVYDSSQNIINCTYTDQTGAGGNVKSGDGTYTYNDTDTIYFNSTYAGINLEVNGSDNWDNYNTANSTWFQNIAGALSLKLSQLTSWADTWIGTKDTDDLSEGSINLYDNSSWNESSANTLYADISITDTNETTRFNTLTETDCGAGNYSYGFDSNGLIKCREDSGNTYTHLTNFTDDLGDRGYTSNLNFTNNAGYYNSTDFSISDYYTKTMIDNFDYYNSTNPQPDSNYTEDEIEAFIFDNDNTANLNMSGYNITSVDYMKFENDNSIYDNSTCVIVEGSTSKLYIC